MDVKKDLRFICDEITSILRYSESKHAIFVAFNGIAIVNMVNILRALFAGETSQVVIYIMCFTVLCLLLAICTCMLSYFPRIYENPGNVEQKDKTNVLFFEHIKEHTVDSYIKLLCTEYGANPDEIGSLERCIISQIIVNAKLASRKFRLFKIAVSFDILAVTAGLGGFIVLQIIR